MNQAQCLAEVTRLGGVLWVQDGGLEYELPDGTATDALLDEIREQRDELVELLTREPMRSPAGYLSGEREILTYQVDLKLIPSVDDYTPDRAVEDFVLDLWEAGAVIFANPDSGSLVLDAARGALGDAQRAFLAARAGGVFEAAHWLAAMEKRALYKKALLWWMKQDDFKWMPGLVVAGRLVQGPWLRATKFFSQNDLPWGEIFAMVDALEAIPVQQVEVYA